MSYDDSFDLPELQSGSRLLSDSSHLRQTEDADLSLSELSLRPQPTANLAARRPFSLLPRRDRLQEPSVLDATELAADDSILEEESFKVENEVGEEGDQTVLQDDGEDEETRQRRAARREEDQAQHDIFMLKKMNAVLEGVSGGLTTLLENRENLARRLEETNALLDRYLRMVARAGKYERLILDERWQGADADEAEIERLRNEAEEEARREEEERLRAQQLEEERIEREAREKAQRAERERLEAERKEKATTRGRGSGVSGVRGTRASMRGAGTRRVAPGRGTSPTTSRPGSSTADGRPPSSGIARGSGSLRGTARPRG